MVDWNTPAELCVTFQMAAIPPDASSPGHPPRANEAASEGSSCHFLPVCKRSNAVVVTLTKPVWAQGRLWHSRSSLCLFTKEPTFTSLTALDFLLFFGSFFLHKGVISELPPHPSSLISILCLFITRLFLSILSGNRPT